MTTGYMPGSFQVTMSPHVERQRGYVFDEALVAALNRALASQSRSVYEEAFFSFNAANTDSDQVPEQHELVALVGAFERLLETSGDAHTATGRLMTLIRPLLGSDRPQHLKRINAFERQHGSRRGGSDRIISTSVTEAWFRDLYRVRNAFGHGRREYDKVPAWNLKGHLLLGAHLFPVAVLVKLASDGHYSLTDRDRAAIKAFPTLASLREPLRWNLSHGPVWPIALRAAHEAEWWRR